MADIRHFVSVRIRIALLPTLLAIAGCANSADSPAVMMERARILMDRQQPEEAIPLISKVIAEQPEEPHARYLRGLAHERLGVLEKAIEDYSECLRLAPDRKDARNNKAVVLARMERFDDAILEFTHLIEMDQDDPLAWRNRGLCYSDLENYQASVSDYNKAIELTPDDPANWFQRGNVFLNKDDFAAAEKDYSEAIRLDPKLARAYMNRCVARYHQGQRSQAGEDLKIAQSLDDSIVLPALSFFEEPAASGAAEGSGLWQAIRRVAEQHLTSRGFSAIVVKTEYPGLSCGRYSAERAGKVCEIFVTYQPEPSSFLNVPAVASDEAASLTEMNCSLLVLSRSGASDETPVVSQFREQWNPNDQPGEPVILRYQSSALTSP